MKQIMRTLLTSVFVLVLVVTTISSVWLASEKKKLGEQYAKDRELWGIKNKTLKESLGRSEEEIKKLKEELENITQNLENANRELGDLKLSYEDLMKENVSLNQKIKNYSQEKENLLNRITQLGKDLKTAEQAMKTKEAQEEFWSRILREKAGLELRARELEQKIGNNRTLLLQLEGERQNLESRLDEVQQQKMNLEKSLSDEKGPKPKSPKDTLKVRLEKENMEQQLADLAGEKDELEMRINTLKSDIDKAESEKKDLTAQIEKVNQLLEERLGEVNRVRQELESALKEAKRAALSGTPGSVELPPIIVKKDAEKQKDSDGGSQPQKGAGTAHPYSTTLKFIPPQTKQAGVVLVNEVNNFVILNIGKKDGVVEGMIFDLYDDKEKIAKVRIKEVRERLSAAQILEVVQNKKIKAEVTQAIYSP